MSDRTPETVEEIIDTCLGDIAAGRRGVAECLARHPELRVELEPLLRAAAELRSLPSFEERAADPARRASLLAELASMPQQSPRRVRLPRLGLPSLGMVVRGLAYVAPAALFIVFALVLLSGRETGIAQASSLAVYSGGVERLEADAWRRLSDGAALSEGDRLRTTVEGRALITFADGSTIALEPGTELVLSRVRRDQGARTIEIEQVTGALWNDVTGDNSAEGGSYLVRTPEATIRVSGAAFSTQVRPGETEITAADGSVEVEANGQRVTLAANESVIARAAPEGGQLLSDRAQSAASTVTIDAPFAASLVSQYGQATGVQPQGEVHQHLPGATTTMPDVRGPQQLSFLGQFPPGEYTLILRRFDDGEGALIVRDASGTTRRIAIDRDVTTELRLVVRVTRAGGAVILEVLSAESRLAPAEVTETLPTPRSEPADTTDAHPTATATTDLSSAREQLVRRLGAEYLATFADALQGGDADALAQALRSATEGDGSVARLLVLREQLRNRSVQLRIIQLLGLPASLPLSLWIDQGDGNLDQLRVAILVTLERFDAEAAANDGADTPSDRPSDSRR